MIGQTISHYKILEKLGEGGMGVVYKAEDTKLKRSVALKFLPPSLLVNEDDRRRFVHEAQASAALSHPNIATVFEIDESEKQSFIALEYIEGQSLAEKIKSGPLKLADAISIAIQVCEGLQAAHEKGIVHRDVKSQNIMVTSKGQVKILDFGLAKLRGVSVVTKAGTTVGTMGYMSPEQLKGQGVDHRTDIWAIGVVLFEMIAGRRPFQGDYEDAVAYQVINQQVEPLTAIRTGVPMILEQIIQKCLEKEASNRYQHTDELLVDLRRAKGSASSVTTSYGAPPRKRMKVRTVLWIGGAVIFIGATIFLYLLLPPAGVRLNPNSTTRTLYSGSFPSHIYHTSDFPFTIPGISRDGNWVSFGAPDDSGKWDLLFMHISWKEPQRVPVHASDPVLVAEISPKGDQILFGPPLSLVSSNGGDIKDLSVPNMGSFNWSADGDHINYVVFNGSPRPAVEFWDMRKDGTDRRLVWADTLSQFGINAFSCSPDGESIAWIRVLSDGHTYTELFTRNLRTGKERQLTFDKKTADEPIWLSNGNIVFMSDRSGVRNIWAVPAQGGEPRRITGGSVDQPTVNVSTEGKWMLVPEVSATTELWVTDLSGVNLPQISLDFYASPFSLAFSDDMRKFAFVKDERPEGWALYVSDHEGKNGHRVAVTEYCPISPAFSPDGKWIAYLEPEKEMDNVCLIELDKKGPRRTFTLQRLDIMSGAWWVDSQNFVVFNNGPKTYLFSVQGGAGKQIFEDSTYAVPILDGQYVVYNDFRKGREGHWTVKLDSRGKSAGQAIKFLPDVPCFFTTDARTCIYEKYPGEFWRISLPSGKEERAGRRPPILAGALSRLRLSNDRKRFGYWVDRVTVKLVLHENVFE